MNLVGKFFVVLILVMSVVFMSLSMAVYSTHRNWRDEFDAKQTELRNVQSVNGQLMAEKNRLESRLTAEQTHYQQQLGKLAAENELLLAEHSALQTRLSDLENQRTVLATTTNTVQENMQTLLAEVNGLPTDIRQAHTARDDSFVKLQEVTEQMHTQQGLLERAREQGTQLARDAARYTALLEQNNLDPNASPDGQPPRVAGEVTDVMQAGNVAQLELSIGSDDGIRTGHVVQVVRGTGTYLGQAKIVSIRPDSAVAEMQREFQQGVVQVGDRVATKL